MIKYKSTILNSFCKNLFFKHDACLHLNRVIFKQEVSCVTVTLLNTTTTKVFSFRLHRLYRINLLCPNKVCRTNYGSSEYRAPLFKNLLFQRESEQEKCPGLSVFFVLLDGDSWSHKPHFFFPSGATLSHLLPSFPIIPLCCVQ